MSDNFEISLWCRQFPPKKEPKQFDLRFHNSLVKFVHLFFMRKRLLEKIILTFSDFC